MTDNSERRAGHAELLLVVGELVGEVKALRRTCTGLDAKMDNVERQQNRWVGGLVTVSTIATAAGAFGAWIISRVNGLSAP